MIGTIVREMEKFINIISPELKTRLLRKGRAGGAGRKMRMNAAEVISICVFYHMSGYKNFKAFYTACTPMIALLPIQLVSYNRFLELRSLFFPEKQLFLKFSMRTKRTGVYYIDSSAIPVCHVERNKWHKTFKGIGQLSKTCMGWFFGFKLHIVINDQAELVSYSLTEARIADVNEANIDRLTRDLQGNLYGDRGYISNRLAAALLERGLNLVTWLKKGMKPRPMRRLDRFFLNKRPIIESVFNLLKNRLELVHTRYRSKDALIGNILDCLIAYTFYKNKPGIKTKRLRSSLVF